MIYLNFFFQLSLPPNRRVPCRTGGGGVDPGVICLEHDARVMLEATPRILMANEKPNVPCVHVQDLFVPSAVYPNSMRRGTPVMAQSSTLPKNKLRPPKQTPARATHV